MGSSISHHGFRFAVKIIQAPIGGGENGGFELLPEEAQTEIENIASLSHPNIVKCFGAELDHGTLNIFMEYMPGGSLSKYILQKQRLTERETAGITVQLLEAVYYLHSKRKRPVMHRDIKGSNILLATDPVNGMPVVVKLCDFGSSTRQISEDLVKKDNPRMKRISPTAIEVLNQEGGSQSCYTSFCADTVDINQVLSCSVKGTCNWIAPEVLKGEPYSAMCDIWSIGCVVVEMLTGKLPWKNFENPVAAMYNIMTSEGTPIDYLPEDIKVSLSTQCIDFLSHCLNRNTATRWTAKRLLRHAWMRVGSLETIPGTPINSNVFSHGTPSSAGTPPAAII